LTGKKLETIVVGKCRAGWKDEESWCFVEAVSIPWMKKGGSKFRETL
jgi:hypothetical protein